MYEERGHKEGGCMYATLLSDTLYTCEYRWFHHGGERERELSGERGDCNKGP